jgi:hypothetical protein
VYSFVPRFGFNTVDGELIAKTSWRQPNKSDQRSVHERELDELDHKTGAALGRAVGATTIALCVVGSMAYNEAKAIPPSYNMFPAVLVLAGAALAANYLQQFRRLQDTQDELVDQIIEPRIPVADILQSNTAAAVIATRS